MSDNISAKQKKKIEAINRRKLRNRVSKYRFNKKSDESKLIQFYVESTDKDILDKYRAFKGQTIGEVFKELIRSILNRRLKEL